MIIRADNNQHKTINILKMDNFIDGKEEMNALYFDKLLINAIDHCMRLNPSFKTPIENDMSRLTDSRDKNMEACIEKYLALHKVFDNELMNQLNKSNKK